MGEITNKTFSLFWIKRFAIYANKTRDERFSVKSTNVIRDPIASESSESKMASCEKQTKSVNSNPIT